MIITRVVCYPNDIVDIGVIATARSCRFLGWHRLFKARATTAVQDAVHASAFEFGLARHAIVGPVPAYTQVKPSNQLSGSAVDQKLQGAPVNV